MIRNIIFDMGGVILPVREIEEPIRRFSQIGMNEDLARQLFSLYGQQGIFLEAECGSLSAEEFIEAYHKLTGYPATFEEIEWAWSGFICDPPRERLQWLNQLRADGYHVALLSNTNPFVMRHCDCGDFTPEGKPIGDFFDRLYYSYHLGACKPNPLAFRRMLELGGYQADECLFLDDGLRNVEAARREGLHVLHVPDNQDWILPLRNVLK